MGFNPSGKSEKFPINPSLYGLRKIEFSLDHLHVRKGVTKCQSVWFEKIKSSLNLEFKP
jgi:hypothetical protein